METQKRVGIESRKKLILTLFLIFMVGCITGWIYEMGFYRINDGYFIKRGQGYGPWLPIYGFGTLAITVLFYNKKESPVTVFLGSALVSGGLEFAVGWLMFHLGNGLRLWDYNVEIWNWGNLGGCVCLRSVLVFGLAGLLCIYIVIPRIYEMAVRPRKISLEAMMIPLGIVFMIDLIVGYMVKPIIGMIR